MKNLIKITLFTLTSLLSFGAYSQACQASFTYTSGTLPGEIIFTDNSTNYPSLGNYSNGLILTTTLLGTNPPFSPFSASQNLNGFITSAGGSKNMVFQYNDTYIVKYYLSNNSGCSSQFIDTIIISSIPTNIPCTAGLNITPGTNSGEFVITDNSIGEDFGIFYNWNNVNQTLTPSNSSANIQYSANGSYFYKYAIFDTIAGCYDSITGNINVNSFPCQAASNIYTNPGSGNIFLQNTSTYAHINTLLTPGATVPSQTNGPYQNFYINYSSNGTYPYTLIILDTISGCTDTLIDSIVVSSFPQPCNIQAGLTITAGSNPGQFNFTDNSTGGSSSYLNPGVGLAGLSILPNPSATYTYTTNGTYNYTYVVSNLNCSDTLLGNLIVTGIDSNCNASFILLQDSLNASQYYCWNSATNSNAGTTNLTYSWDFGDGNSSSLAYPTHTYTSLGIFTICLTITEVGTNCTSTHCDTIVVSVKASGTTLNVLPAGTNLGVEEQKLINEVSLYPNPSNGKFTIELDATNKAEIEISIVNLAGQTLYKETRSISSGNNKLTIAEHDLAVGTYLVSISNRSSGEIKTLRLVKN